jgi:hypothetical protein
MNLGECAIIGTTLEWTEEERKEHAEKGWRLQ